jgi:uncharacterized protein (TIGR03086 family)
MAMLDLHARVLRQSIEIVDAAGDDEWERPTPCAEWTLRELIEHMILENRGFAVAAGGETSERRVWTDRTFGPDLRADYRASAERVVEAFAAPGVLDGEFWLPLINPAIRLPARQAVSFHLLDYVVHAWDVAAAIGRPVQVPTDIVEAALDIALREVPDGPRRHRPHASFVPPVEPAPGAPALDRMLAWLGRSPTWPD